MDWLILEEVTKALHRSNGSLIMHAWGHGRINEQKHPEIAWAADTHYLSHLAATLDNQPVFSPPWQMLRECQRVHGETEAYVRANLSACACAGKKKSLAMQRHADHGI